MRKGGWRAPCRAAFPGSVVHGSKRQPGEVADEGVPNVRRGGCRAGGAAGETGEWAAAKCSKPRLLVFLTRKGRTERRRPGDSEPSRSGFGTFQSSAAGLRCAPARHFQATSDIANGWRSNRKKAGSPSYGLPARHARRSGSRQIKPGPRLAVYSTTFLAPKPPMTAAKPLSGDSSVATRLGEPC